MNSRYVKYEGMMRLLSKVQARPDGCIVWTGLLNSAGYGKTGYNYKTVTAHRLSCMMFNGDIPSGESVLHMCDNPACVNVDHLFLGNQRDNVEDCISKGRHTKGEKQGLAVLDEEKVIEIRRLYAKGNWSQKKLGRTFGVNAATIAQVVKRKTWKHVT